MSDFQEECNKILNNESLFEEDKVDLLEDLVLKRRKCTPKEAEKVILDILWRHKDPSKKNEHAKAKIVAVQDIETKVDIPSFERRLELEKQVRELEALNEKSRQKKNRSQKENDTIDNEYQQLLSKTQDLRQQLYGEKRHAPIITSSPIDQLNDLFNGSIPKQRIEQALRANGYEVIEAATHLMNQLKASEVQTEATVTTPPTTSEPFFSVDKKNKTLCSFFIKNGSCLRADCKFSHDIDSRICSFWLKGNCLAGEKCLFKHSFDLSTSELDKEEILPASTSNITTSTIGSPSTKFSKFNGGSVQSFVPSKAIKIVKPIKKPASIPWENTFESDCFKSYINNRNVANRNESQRKKFAKMSTDAWRTNDSGKAKQLSDKANRFEETSIDALKLADDDLYNYSENNDTEVWFEMHGLEFNDAVEQLSGSLLDVKAKEKANSKIAYIVVPSINDVSGYKKTTKPITIWLDHTGYRWQLFGCGNGIYGSLIGIDPWSI